MKKKNILWAIVDIGTGIIMDVYLSRSDARRFREPDEKVVKIEYKIVK